MSGPDYIVDIAGLSQPDDNNNTGQGAAKGTAAGKGYLSTVGKSGVGNARTGNAKTGQSDSPAQQGSANRSQPNAQNQSSSRGNAPLQGRPWISVRWKCCSAYSRIYRNRKGTAYEGRCPRCGSQVKATVGEGGTSNRFFEAQ